MNGTQRLRRPWAPWLAALLLCVAFPAMARHHRHLAEEGQPGQFDYYLLALSWSPTYCLLHEEDVAQCQRKGLGFVLHGLWPQQDAGGYPQNCAADAVLSPQAAALGGTLYPSPRLVQHEWQRHGTCSGMNAMDYFRTADRALAAIKVPALFEAPAHSLTLDDSGIVAAFRAANPALAPDGLTVACSRGQLSEVRVCLTRTLALRSCGRGVRSSCSGGTILVRASR